MSVLRLVLASLLVLAAAGCDEKKPAPAGAAAPPPAVLVVTAAEQPVTQGMEFVGRVEALERVDIRARVTGFLRERTFVEGQVVAADDMIFQIEPEPFQAEVALKQAAIDRAKAELHNAELQVARGRELIRTNAIPQSTLDQRIAEQQTAAAALSGAQAELQRAQIQLGYTQIVSPIAGRIGRATLTPGNVVGPDSGVLTSVVRQDQMRVTFPVTQRQILEFRRKAADKAVEQIQVRLKLSDGTVFDQVGKVNFLDVQTDKATDSVLVQALFPNPQALLSDGQFVGVVVEAEAPKQAILIPQSAVQVDQAGAFLLVVGEGNKVEQKRVKLGRGPTGQQVVEEGLAVGARVITEGGQRARPGAVVAPRPAPPMLGQARAG
ncbi:efflux RND transporter periplasmic adaptor subunit [Dankookia sp. GCM10030260]|uniref:efflux RND transporter periplasmic adaptor subunit n=1 Tax=Dankookia sp. GCM10030260 TaxID=3273390 RepID=UPI00360F3D23